VEEAENLFTEPPMTYAYYRGVIKGKAPKNAPTHVAETEKPIPAQGAYTCGVCGYEYHGGKEQALQLSENWVCPICGAAKSVFSSKS